MKRKLLSVIVFAVICMAVLSLAGCSLLSGLTSGGGTTDTSGENGGEGENGKISSDKYALTGDIPFSLENDFYLFLEVKSVAGALNPTYCTFTAIRTGETIYANYTFFKYASEDYEAKVYKEKYIEERILHEGINFRKSFAELSNTSDHLYTAYEEDWNTIVPDGTTMTTTAQYIQNFLSGNHVADAPYASGIFQSTLKRIPSLMSTQYIHDISINTASVEMYEDGIENMTFGVFTNDDTDYTPEQAFSASVKKYRGTYFSETTIMNVKTWGNLVVFAAQANGSPVLKRTVSCNYTATVSQETFEAVLAAAGYTVDPVIPE